MNSPSRKAHAADSKMEFLRDIYRGTSVTTLAVILAVLVWGALPYLPGQIDDAYIVFAYAHNIVERGEIVWNTGERVEGYSSPLHLAFMVLGVIGGFDLSILSRILSFAATIATIGLISVRLFGPQRAWLALFLAAWQPLQMWATGGLETALSMGIATAAWPLVLASHRGWSFGCWLLGLYALARPEGIAWFGVALVLRLRHPWSLGAKEWAVAGLVTSLVVYHVARISYFDAVFPTPWLVKIQAIDQFGRGMQQLGQELLSAAPLLLLTMICRRNIPVWCWFPMVLQSALLVRAGGDWMGHARLLLPGLVASVGAAFATGTPRKGTTFWPVVLVPVAACAFAWESSPTENASPRWRDKHFLRSPLTALRTISEVPMLAETALIVDNVPEGSGVQLSDVGLPGNLQNVPVFDGAGLTDRAVALLIASRGAVMSEVVAKRYGDPATVGCIRYSASTTGDDPIDGWQREAFPVLRTAPDVPQNLIWRCRRETPVEPAVAYARWAALLERFPRQDEIRWRTARALFVLGEPKEALALAAGASWVGDDAGGWVAFSPAAGEAYHPDRGWPLYRNGERRTVALQPDFWTAHALWIDVDDPGDDGAAVAVHWEPPCGEEVISRIRTRSELTFPPCNTAAESALVVEFRNDESKPGFDRNAYVTLRPQSAR